MSMDIITKARSLRHVIQDLAQTLEDEQAVENKQLYAEWSSDGVDYKLGNKRRYNGTLYKCLQPHTSIVGYEPDQAVSLWAEVLIPDPEQIYDWKQPQSTNPYMTGDKVRHNGKIWISTQDYNVFQPGVAGWDEVIE